LQAPGVQSSRTVSRHIGAFAPRRSAVAIPHRKQSMKKTVLITLTAALLTTALLTPVVLLAQEEDLTFETVTKMVVVLTEQIVTLTEEFTDLKDQVDALTERSTDLEERVDAIDELLPETPIGVNYQLEGNYCPAASSSKSTDAYTEHLYEEKWPGENLPVEYQIANVWQHKVVGDYSGQDRSDLV